jgi:succinate dehydrogenase / fumarate reductase, cytochrome b subunit
MNWFSSFITSSIGQKLIMALTGLFLILFLVVHLAGNLQLLQDDGGRAFNVYAYFMTTNPLIKTVSWGLYAFILLHAIQGIMLALKNRKARGAQRYAVQTTSNTSYASRNMALMGTLILFFLGVHMGDFWYQMKFTDQVALVTYDGQEFKDLFAKVALTFSQPWYVVIYVLSMLVLGVHLWHGFQSAFQTLGLRHRKYTPLVQWIGKAFAIVVPVLYAMIPLIFYFFMKKG